MQNSYGRLEQSYIKCSPIFPGMTSDTGRNEQNSELIQNFPLSSMLQNKTAVIRSNFDLNADMMTPYYKRASLYEEQGGNNNIEAERAEGGQQGQRDLQGNQTELKSGNTRTFGPNASNRGVSLNSSLLSGVRANNSAFLLNYQANAKTTAQAAAASGGNIQNSFSHIYSNLNNNFNGIKPNSSIFMRKNMEPRNSTPVNLTIINNNNYNLPNFQPKIREVIKIAGFERERINREKGKKGKTSKLSNKLLNFDKKKFTKKKGNYVPEVDSENYENIPEPSDSDSDSFFERSQVKVNNKELTRKTRKKNSKNEERLEKIEIVLPSNKIEKKKPVSKKNEKNKNLKNKKVISNEKQSSRDEVYSSEDPDSFSDEYSQNDEESECDEESEEMEPYIAVPIEKEEYGQKNNIQTTPNNKRRSNQEKKIKSIRDLVNSTKKYKQEKRARAKKQNDDQKEQVLVFNNIETNKFTKRIVEDTINRNFSNILYNKKNSEFYGGHRNPDNVDNNSISCSSNQVLTRKKEDKIFSKRSKVKLRRSKKTNQTRAEITMIEKDPVSIQDIEYLLEDIRETPELNSSCSFINRSLKSDYLEYMTRGKSNEGKLSFGRNPLVIYQELTDWLLKEKKKLEEDIRRSDVLQSTTDLCAMIQNDMNGISKFTSSLPVIKMPDDHRKQNRKRKRASQILTDDDKKFKCEVCARDGREQYFETGQGLGGHMSRVHKGKSDKFNKKKEIRNKREEYRKILMEAKIKMLWEKDLDYEFLMKSKDGKMKVKNFIKENRDKYRKLVRELRRNKRHARAHI